MSLKRKGVKVRGLLHAHEEKTIFCEICEEVTVRISGNRLLTYASDETSWVDVGKEDQEVEYKRVMEKQDMDTWYHSGQNDYLPVSFLEAFSPIRKILPEPFLFSLGGYFGIR